MTLEELYDRAWEYGNFASAYETNEGVREVELEELSSELGDEHPAEFPWQTEDVQAAAAGLVLGYYSSYEHHEIEELELELFDAALRFASKYKLDTHLDSEYEEAHNKPFSKEDAKLLEELMK